MHNARYILLYLNCVNLKCIFDITRLTAHSPGKSGHLTILVLKNVKKKKKKEQNSYLFFNRHWAFKAKAITEPARTMLESL